MVFYSSDQSIYQKYISNYLLIKPLLHIDNQISVPILLKVQSCKLYYNKYMITSIQITNTEIFAFIAVLVF